MARDLLSLTGKTALVTGASSGFGWHFAHVLARAGAKVALAARRLDRLETLAAEIRGTAARRRPSRSMSPIAPRSPAPSTAAEAALGPVTILVNNAGVPVGLLFPRR